jgi:hypothetical protein
VVAGAVVLVVAVAGAVLMLFVLHGRVTAQRLAASVGRDVPGSGSCRPAFAPRAWTCGFRLDSDGVGYAVRVRAGSSCWNARLIGGGAGHEDIWPSRASGCVRRWQW